MAIRWSDEIMIGVPDLDEQHRELFRTCQALMAALKEGRGREQVAQTLNELQEYSEKHFETEERYMKRYGYEKIALHQELHEDFRRNLRSLKRRLASEGITTFLILDTQQHVVKWWKDHILEKDTVLASFLREKGLGKNAA